MAKALDCATSLTTESAKRLADEGYDIVCRYLGDSWKTYDRAEAEAISEAGMKVVSIYETNPTHDSYFTAEQGKQDAQNAAKYAKQVGQPEGTAIYFTVDYGGGNSNLGQVLNYFQAIKKNLNGYKVGGYGSYAVVKYLYEQGAVDYVWQTYAWSNGREYEKANLFQHKNGVTVAGISVDLNKVLHDPGAWAVITEPKRQTEAAHITADTNTYHIEDGDTLWDLENKWHLHHGTLERLNPKVDPNRLQVGQKINVPDAVRKDKPEHDSKAIVPYPGHYIKVGSNDHHNIKRVQRAVGVKPDGIFGPKTKVAVEAYQRRHGLSVDGIVGPATWNTLF